MKKVDIALIICCILIVIFGLVLPLIQNNMIEKYNIEAQKVEPTGDKAFDNLNNTLHEVIASEANLVTNILFSEIFQMFEMILTLGLGVGSVLIIIYKFFHEDSPNIVLAIIIVLFIAYSEFNSINTYFSYGKTMTSDFEKIADGLMDYSDSIYEEFSGVLSE